MTINPNQKHDTIPKKPAGRQHNAVSHGIYAEILLEGHAFQESEAAYQRLLEGLRASSKPETTLEDVLVEELAFLFLRLTRLYKAEARIAPRMFEVIERGLVEEEPHVSTQCVWEGEVPIVRKELSPELLLRYEASLERSIDRTLTQLERLQRMRLGLAVLPPVKLEIT
jgi:hypothetical protein